MGKLVSIVTTRVVGLGTRNFYVRKILSDRFKWVFWTIHNYNYEISGVVLLIYLVNGLEKIL